MAKFAASFNVNTTAQQYDTGVNVGGLLGPFAAGSSTGLNPGYGTFIGATFMDPTAQDVVLELWLFNNPPIVTVSDHTYFALSANDVTYVIGVLTFSNYSDSAAASGQGVRSVSVIRAAQLPYYVPNSNNMWLALVTRGKPTYGITTLTLRVLVDRD